MKNIKNWIEKAGIKLWMAKEEFLSELKEDIKNESGAAFTELLIKIIISIVIGALILGALYFMFKDTLIPKIQEKMLEMFNPPARP